MKVFKIRNKNDVGKRLDILLCLKLRKFSRASIQNNIKKGSVYVNKKQIYKCSYRTKLGDEINFKEYLSAPNRYQLIPKKMEIEVIYQDKNILVVNKTNGLVVHPAKTNRNNTLINGLIYKYKKLTKLGENRKYGLIHRIDKDTSGLVMVALNDKTLWFYSRLFEKREVDKYYLVIVKGDFRTVAGKRNKLLVSNFIGRNPKNRKKFMVIGKDKDKGRLASTYFYFIDNIRNSKLGDISLIIAKPITGRTHQIRVHLTFLGFPIIGDKVYSKTNYKRMLLHAYKIRIRGQDNKIMSFVTRVPKAFSEVFNMNKIIQEVYNITR